MKDGSKRQGVNEGNRGDVNKQNRGQRDELKEER